MRNLFRYALVLALISGGVAEAPAADKPNIIFILADDMGYGEPSCYGNKAIKTPNIDRLAAEGIRFTDFYAGGTVCSPSRATLMTGLHNGHGWIRANGPENLRPTDVIIPEVLKKVGYTNGVVGKWGIGVEGSTGLPRKKGFDYFYGYLNNFHAHNHYPSFLWRNEEKHLLPNEQLEADPRGGGVASKKVVYSTDRFGEEAVDFIARSKDNPFFLYLAFTVPHANNEAKNKGMEVPDYGIYASTDWPDPQKGQAAMDSRMDMHIGNVMAKVKELGIDDRTLIIFTSDNGPHKEGGGNPDFHDSNGPVRGTKRDLTDGGIRVPFVARWQGKIAPGQVSNHIGSSVDMMATLADLAGAEAPKTDGISIVPTLLGKPNEQKKHDYLYWEFHEGGFGQAVRFGDWKAVRTSRGKARGSAAKTELYQIVQDIGEERDVASAHPDIVAKAEKMMAEAHTPWEGGKAKE
ncbi:arylsulfatase [Humisphaera borealis]|uniref:Arylsulfatase n=1 Tax=Humisphaera borealis TaxID=2807512 RepID=A0A7M2WRV8_9BACT|nr:arylsulfatase [Humisphaera borealis]QOV87340.1 arylsulfatase [Humisphaera borealis]